MSTPLATAWQQLGDLTGPEGPAGGDGVSISGAVVNTSGDLVLTLSTGAEITAGHVRGEAAPILDPETSVQAISDLPDTPAVLAAFLVRDNGHWYIFEGDGAADDGKPGYTDVGQIRGETGATGAAGAPGTDGSDGVSVTGAAIDGNGHLIISLSQGGPVDAGVARGAPGTPGTDGTDGTNGADGAPGEMGIGVIAYTAPSVPDPTTYRVGTIAIGSDGSLLRATG